MLPASFDAEHVYTPLCLYPTDWMVSIDVRVPNNVVEMLGSEETTSPCKDHDKDKGSSPLLTMQITWANSPSSIVSFPNVNGRICGDSVQNEQCY